MSAADQSSPKSPVSHLHAMNLVVAMLAGIISIVGGVYTLKTNVFAGPQYGSLQGVVRDEKLAKPLWLSSVEVSGAEDGAIVATVTTDKEGHYQLKTLGTGHYAVKFTAPRHQAQTKAIKIEKGLTSSIDVDLVPEEEDMKNLSTEVIAAALDNSGAAYPAASVQGYQTSAAPYAGTPVPVVQNQGYPVQPVMQSPAPVQTAQAGAGTQTYPGPSNYGNSQSDFSEPPPFVHHRRRRPPPGGYPSGAGQPYSQTSSDSFYGGGSGAAQTQSSSNDALVATGIQVVQQLFNKKASEDQTTST
ncbi:MAG: carboxypeptidase regulatory-like domain-containing protein [Candidatus Omnitrophica bacterium]|nr:carboxypeptidase regulatory-like domain-containing protein [Candidatus Omnitrophota bacterium]MDD5671363.1 carboxypeptidase regulatory-like domain-containing protein [Candidatus Omnitrophota bacterium]